MPLLKVPPQKSSSNPSDVLDAIPKSLQEGIPEKSENASSVEHQRGPSHVLIPRYLEKKILHLLDCYPDGLELEKFTYAYSKRFGEHLIPAKHGFADIIDLLNAMSDKVSRVSDSHGRQLLASKEGDKDISGSIAGGIKKINSMQSDVSCMTSSSATQTQFKNTNEDHRIERSDCYRDKECTMPCLPQEMIQTFRSILDEHKGGIMLNNLIPEYEIKTRKQLVLADFGFSSLYDFVTRMKDIFKICKTDNHYVIYNPESVKISHISYDFKDAEEDQNCAERLLSVEAQERLMYLLQEEYPDGLSMEEIIPAYRGLFGATLDDLNPLLYGYRSLIGLFQAHSDLVILQYCNDSVMVHSSQAHLKNETSRPTTFPAEAVQFGSKYKGLDRNALLPIGEFVEVVIAEVYSPLKFWVVHRGIDTSQALDCLMDKMFEFYTGKIGNRYLVPNNLITIGAPVAALYADDGNYYRALITAIEDLTTVKLFLIDYGTMYRCDTSYLRLLHRQYFKLPAQAVRASLDEIEPVDGRRLWSKMASKTFLNLVLNKGLVAYIKQIKDSQGTVCMDLYDTSDPDDINIASVLIEGGWARKTVHNSEDGLAESGSQPHPEAPIQNENENKFGGSSIINEPIISASDPQSFFLICSSRDLSVGNIPGDNCTNVYQDDNNASTILEVSGKMEATANELYNQTCDNVLIKHTPGPPVGFVPGGSFTKYAVTVSSYNLPNITSQVNCTLSKPVSFSGNLVQQNKLDFVEPSPVMCGREITESLGNSPAYSLESNTAVNNAEPISACEVNMHSSQPAHLSNHPLQIIPPPPGFEPLVRTQLCTNSAFATRVTQAIDYPKMSPCPEGVHWNTINSQLKEGRDDTSHWVERLSINATCVFHVLFLYGKPYILCDDIVKLLASCGVTEVTPLLKELELPTVSIGKITDKNLYLQLLELGCRAIFAEDQGQFDIQPHISAYSLTDVSHILHILGQHNKLIHNASEMLMKHYGKDKESLGGLSKGEKKAAAASISSLKVPPTDRTVMSLESCASSVSAPISRFLHCSGINMCSVESAPIYATSTINFGCNQVAVTRGAPVNTCTPLVLASKPTEISPIAVSLCSTSVSSSGFENLVRNAPPLVTNPTSVHSAVNKFETTLSSHYVGSLKDPAILTYSNIDLNRLTGMSHKTIFSSQHHVSNAPVSRNPPTSLHTAVPLHGSLAMTKFAAASSSQVQNTNYVDSLSEPATDTLVKMDPSNLLRPSVMPVCSYLYHEQSDHATAVNSLSHPTEIKKSLHAYKDDSSANNSFMPIFSSSEFSAASHMPMCYTSEVENNDPSQLGKTKLCAEPYFSGASEFQTCTVAQPCLLDHVKCIGRIPSSEGSCVNHSVPAASGKALHTSPKNSQLSSAPRNPRFLLQDVSAKGLRRPANFFSDLVSMLDKKSDVNSLQTVPNIHHVYPEGNYSDNLYSSYYCNPVNFSQSNNILSKKNSQTVNVPIQYLYPINSGSQLQPNSDKSNATLYMKNGVEFFNDLEDNHDVIRALPPDNSSFSSSACGLCLKHQELSANKPLNDSSHMTKFVVGTPTSQTQNIHNTDQWGGHSLDNVNLHEDFSQSVVKDHLDCNDLPCDYNLNLKNCSWSDYQCAFHNPCSFSGCRCGSHAYDHTQKMALGDADDKTFTRHPFVQEVYKGNQVISSEKEMKFSSKEGCSEVKIDKYQINERRTEEQEHMQYGGTEKIGNMACMRGMAPFPVPQWNLDKMGRVNLDNNSFSNIDKPEDILVKSANADSSYKPEAIREKSIQAKEKIKSESDLKTCFSSSSSNIYDAREYSTVAFNKPRNMQLIEHTSTENLPCAHSTISHILKGPSSYSKLCVQLGLNLDACKESHSYSNLISDNFRAQQHFSQEFKQLIHEIGFINFELQLRKEELRYFQSNFVYLDNTSKLSILSKYQLAILELKRCLKEREDTLQYLAQCCQNLEAGVKAAK